MGLLWTVLIGFLVGSVAKFLLPGHGPGGFLRTTLLGILGSFFGGWVSSAVGMSGRVGFIGSVLGAALLLVIFRFFEKRSA